LDILDTLASLLAQATPPDGAPAGAPAGPPGTPPPPAFQFLQSFGPLLLIIALFFFLFIRPKQKQERVRRQMLETLKKGDEIQTIGGVFGKVIETRDDRVQIKVDESSNTKMWFARSAIHRIVAEDRA
jgi:preprotein translocase subunit YajC